MKQGKDYLDTTTLNGKLREKTLTSGSVTMTAQIIKFILTLTSNIILARLLLPEDYGLIAMVTGVVNFALLFKDLGFTSAIIQKKDIILEQVNALFWINALVTMLLTLIVVCLSPLISIFYNEPKLTWITILLSATFIFQGLSAIHQALLRRQMDFIKVASIEVFSLLIAVIVGIIFAVLNFSYWSLVIMQITNSLVTLFLSFYFCKWIPGPPKKGVAVSELVKFGANLTGFNVLNYFSRNADDLLIGKFLGATQLGLYSRAYNLFLMPLRQINGPLNAVALPALSRLIVTPVKYKKAYLTLIESILTVTTPIIIFLIVESDQVILLLLGEKWLSVSEVFAILAIAGLVQPVSNTTGLLFITQNRTGEQLKWGVVGSVLITISFIVGLPYGIKGVAASYVISDLVIRTPILYAWVGRKGPVKQADFYKSLYPHIISGIVTFIIVLFLKDALPSFAILINLSIVCACTLLVYYLCLSLFVKGRGILGFLFGYFIDQFKRLRKKLL